MHTNPETLPDITKDPRAQLAIRAALKEDIGAGDATTLALVGGVSMPESTAFLRG